MENFKSKSKEQKSKKASKKANLSYDSGQKYYKQHLNSQTNEICIPGVNSAKSGKACTQDQINELFRYILDDKMPSETAAIKCNMSLSTARKFYNIYLKNPSNGVPNPTEKANNSKPCTQNQINKLFRYILKDKISIDIAAVKCIMSLITARKYYQLYLDSPSKEIPNARTSGKFCTQEQINNLINYIVNDKMTITQALLKAYMCYKAASKYYSQYLNDPHHQIPTPNRRISVFPTKAQVTSLIDYMNNDKLSMPSAAKKSNMKRESAHRYYNRYKNNLQKEMPERVGRKHPKAWVKKLIDYITVNKLTVKVAAKMSGMCYGSALFYYRKFKQNSQNDNITSGTV